MTIAINKSHRTALFLNPEGDKERQARLLESLNGENIKVDVYGIVSTPTFGRINAVPDDFTAAPKFDVEVLIREAKAAHYDQVLVAV